jgi:hypothetical protein
MQRNNYTSLLALANVYILVSAPLDSLRIPRQFNTLAGPIWRMKEQLAHTCFGRIVFLLYLSYLT